MATRKKVTLDATPVQAQEFLQRLVDLGKVTMEDLAEVRRVVVEEMEQIEARLHLYRGTVAAAAIGGVVAGASVVAARVMSSRKAAKSSKAARTPRAAKASRPAKSGATAKRSTPRARKGGLSDAERDATRKLQGRYLGLLGAIPKNQRDRFKNMISSHGKQAAVDAMELFVRQSGKSGK